MLLQQRRQLISGGFAIELRDRGADVFLVFHQPVRRSRRVGLIAHGRDDVVASPDDVIRPEFPHVLMKRDRWRSRAVGLMLLCGNRWDHGEQRHERGQRCPSNLLHDASPSFLWSRELAPT